jgi:hypothetical protein
LIKADPETVLSDVRKLARLTQSVDHVGPTPADALSALLSGFPSPVT